ncbi:MAG: hypothetical protein D6768_05185 [Chloroflexi bacterium]|nr:MAG: hypothetical protein D6768_05185 [Chloroflexota bacterium]
MLPVPGEILVAPGQPVNALTVVGRAERPTRFRFIDVARRLGRPDIDLDEVLTVDVGDYVEANDVVASGRSSALSLRENSVKSPVAGYVMAIGPGGILLESEHTVTEIQAFVTGVVTRVIPEKGVIIETDGATIEAVCGFGGEAVGRLLRVVNSPFESMTPDDLNESASETILLGGRSIDEETLRRADEWHVHGIIVGSFPVSLLGLDPPVQVRVVATEGFGQIPMSPHTFGVLTSLSRREVSIRGQTPGLFGGKPAGPLQEPPIILAPSPLPSRGSYVGLPAAPKIEAPTAKVGSKVRVIQGQLLGASGQIDLIPPDAQATEAGIIAPGAFVKLGDGVHFIPWANLQLIE